MDCSARQPGTLTGYVSDKCRCPQCRAAATAYAARCRKQIAYGRWQPFVDAEPARQHLRALMAAGIGCERVAQFAGVAKATVSTLLYGRDGRGPTKRLRPDVSAAILAVKPSPSLLADGALVDATGTRRRIQALMAIGWCRRAQAAEVGIEETAYGYYARANRVTVRTARLIRELYERLWNLPAPASTGRSRALAAAKRSGYLPPLAWDDIDDPRETPHTSPPQSPEPDWVVVERALTGADVDATTADRVAAVAALRARGVTRTQIAVRLHTSTKIVARLEALAAA